MKTTKIFFDTEFTGLHKNTTLISIGLVSECGKTFYAELTDYDKTQIGSFTEEFVIKKLILPELKENEEYRVEHNGDDTTYKGPIKYLREEISIFLSQFHSVEFWGDVLAYDWVLFVDIFGDAFSLPPDIDYIAYDIATIFKMRGLEPDISRDFFLYGNPNDNVAKGRHNALLDAKIIARCYNKLMAF